MKISKKILTFLAPIATVAAAVPAIVACNKESFSFSYGDSINCYKKTEKLPNTAIHSLNIVKSESIGHVNEWQAETVNETQLASYLSSASNVYFDLVASLAHHWNKGFALSWKENATVTPHTFEIYIETESKAGGEECAGLLLGADITYETTTEAGKTDIMLNIKHGSDFDFSIKSYAFKNAKIIK